MSRAILWVLHFLLFINFLSFSVSIEPISTAYAIGAAVAAGLSYFDKTPCRFVECCDRYSVAFDTSNITALKSALEKSVYGQHLVQDVVVRALKGHLNSPDPAKALVISFHGSTGCGKSFVSQFIAQSLYAKGMQSTYVKKFVGGHHFPDHSASMVALYKLELAGSIRETVKMCPRSLFIFEDMHLMPQELLDSIVPFIDYHKNVEKIDYRKAIFILLSNTGAKQINQKALDLWATGKMREDYTLRDFENIIRLGAFNEEGGLHQSKTISAHLIDHHVPFLPLEEKHVKLCILAAFKKYGYNKPSDDIVQGILDDLTFMPEGQRMYSASGCKRVEAKVGSVVQGLSFTKF